MAVTLAGVDRYLAEFEALERRGAFRDPAWLAALRRRAIAHVAERGFPTTRDEDWRYTSLAALVRTPFRHAAGARDELPAGVVHSLAVADAAWPRLVFVDGRHAPKLSTPGPLGAGAAGRPTAPRAGSLAAGLDTEADVLEPHLGRQADWDGNVFAALNTAFVEDGALVVLPAEAAVEALELLFVTTTPGVATWPRTLVVAGPHSRIGLIERHVGLTGEPYLAAPVTEILVGPGAVVDHHVVQEQGMGAFHVATLHATLERDSRFTTSGATFGGGLARTTMGVRFAAPGGQAAIDGLYVVGGRQHVDHHVTVDHAVPRCRSEQLFKGVLDDTARAVFNGRIIVRPDAQKTDATQTNKHLLLSDGVEVDSKPQLEIFADDVRCTHGAAEGQLAPEALFYLRSRGIGEGTARALLTYGFAREVLERVAVAPLQAYLDARLAARLHRERATKEAV